ncbi:addiction module protein, partial [Planctomycetota bacterium]
SRDKGIFLLAFLGTSLYLLERALFAGKYRMSDTLKDIEEKALNLPESERAVLAEHLISSLENKYDPDVEAEWIKEAEKRYQAFKAGDITGIPAQEALNKARNSLK